MIGRLTRATVTWVSTDMMTFDLRSYTTIHVDTMYYSFTDSVALDQIPRASSMLSQLHCLDITDDGFPRNVSFISHKLSIKYHKLQEHLSPPKEHLRLLYRPHKRPHISIPEF